MTAERAVPNTRTRGRLPERHQIRDWGKKVVFAVNKMDIHEDAVVERVLAFVEDHARQPRIASLGTSAAPSRSTGAP